MAKRTKGYVIAGDPGQDGKVVWKVRVKDLNSPHNGQKLPVASTHRDIDLSRGINVNFRVGTRDGTDGSKFPCAVDVDLEPTSLQVEWSKGGKD